MKHNFDTDYDFEIVCDGGCHGQGTYQEKTTYGSWRIRSRWRPAKLFPIVEFDKMYTTSNQAEYLTLIASVEYLIGKIHEAHQKPSSFSLLVKTDSQLIVGHFGFIPKQKVPWRCKNPKLAELKRQATSLLEQFGKYCILKVDGTSYVKQVLGH